MHELGNQGRRVSPSLGARHGGSGGGAHGCKSREGELNECEDRVGKASVPAVEARLGLAGVVGGGELVWERGEE